MATLDDLKGVLDSIDISIRSQSTSLDALVSGQQRSNDLQRTASQLGSVDRSAVSNVGQAASGIGQGIGVAAAGIGEGIGIAGVGGLAGIAALKLFESFDANAIKDNVETLLSIKTLSLWDTSGLLTTLGGIGLALVAFGAGQAATAIAQFISTDDWAEVLKTNVETLLSIGTLDFWETAGIISTLGGIGSALAAFGAGQAATAIAQFISADDWAQQVKDNVETLLSIGTLDFWDTAGMLSTLGGIGAALTAFSVGQGAVGLAQFATDDNWAQEVKNNVETLLSIGTLDFWKTAGLLGTLTGIGAALGAFALGKGSEGVAATGQAGVQLFTGQPFAERIKSEVETLLSITQLPGIDEGTAWTFAKTMGLIGGGLLAFALGKTAEGAATAGQSVLEVFGQGDFITRIVSEVTTLIGLVDTLDGDGDDSKAGRFFKGMSKIAGGLLAFTASDAIGQLAGVGQAILSFFGLSSPFEKIMEISAQADELEKGANALEKIANALNTFGNISIADMDIDFVTMAENLGKAIPLFEALARGGPVKGSEGWFSGPLDFGKGILDPELKLDEISDRIAKVRNALSLDLNPVLQQPTEVSTVSAADLNPQADKLQILTSYTDQMVVLSQNILKSLQVIEDAAKPQTVSPTIIYAPTTDASTKVQNNKGGNSTLTNIGGGGRSELDYGLPRGPQ